MQNNIPCYHHVHTTLPRALPVINMLSTCDKQVNTEVSILYTPDMVPVYGVPEYHLFSTMYLHGDVLPSHDHMIRRWHHPEILGYGHIMP